MPTLLTFADTAATEVNPEELRAYALLQAKADGDDDAVAAILALSADDLADIFGQDDPEEDDADDTLDYSDPAMFAAPPNGPPRPGLVWKEETHRWVTDPSKAPAKKVKAEPKAKPEPAASDDGPIVLGSPASPADPSSIPADHPGHAALAESLSGVMGGVTSVADIRAMYPGISDADLARGLEQLEAAGKVRGYRDGFDDALLAKGGVRRSGGPDAPVIGSVARSGDAVTAEDVQAAFGNPSAAPVSPQSTTPAAKPKPAPKGKPAKPDPAAVHAEVGAAFAAPASLTPEKLQDIAGKLAGMTAAQIGEIAKAHGVKGGKTKQEKIDRIVNAAKAKAPAAGPSAEDLDDFDMTPRAKPAAADPAADTRDAAPAEARDANGRVVDPSLYRAPDEDAGGSGTHEAAAARLNRISGGVAALRAAMPPGTTEAQFAAALEKLATDGRIIVNEDDTHQRAGRDGTAAVAGRVITAAYARDPQGSPVTADELRAALGDAPAPAPAPKSAAKPKSTGHPGVDAALAELAAAPPDSVTARALDAALGNLGIDPVKPGKVTAPARDVAGAMAGAWLQAHRATGGDPTRLAPLERAMKAHGMQPVGEAGGTAPFDGKVHQHTGPQVSAGTPVKVTRAGWVLPEAGGASHRLVPAATEAHAGGGGTGATKPTAPASPPPPAAKPAPAADAAPARPADTPHGKARAALDSWGVDHADLSDEDAVAAHAEALAATQAAVARLKAKSAKPKPVAPVAPPTPAPPPPAPVANPPVPSAAAAKGKLPRLTGDHIDATERELDDHRRNGDMAAFDAATKGLSGPAADAAGNAAADRAADAKIAAIKARHTPDEIHEIARRAVGKVGKTVDQSLALLRTDMGMVRDGVLSQRV